MKQQIRKLWTLSLSDIGRYLKKSYHKAIVKNMVDYPASVLNEKGRKRQQMAIFEILKKMERGANLLDLLKNKNLKLFGERIVEYPYFFEFVKKIEKGKDILDVGCVLNNTLVNNILTERFKSIWFCNPEFEEIQITKIPVYYHRSSLEKSFYDGKQFPIVTCLSTIEHIGYDNSQYGSLSTASFNEPNIEPFITSFKKLAMLTKSKGNLLISFPYGFREVLIHPVTAKRSSQVMDYSSVIKCIPILEENGMSVEFFVFAITSNGWEMVDPKSCKARYAKEGPAASAVAILDCKKN